MHLVFTTLYRFFLYVLTQKMKSSTHTTSTTVFKKKNGNEEGEKESEREAVNNFSEEAKQDTEKRDIYSL